MGGSTVSTRPIALEIKLTVLVGIYAFYKTLTDSGILDHIPKWRGIDLFVLMNRVAFIICHALLLIQYTRTAQDILADTKLNTSIKLSRRKNLKSVMRRVLLRALCMAGVHLYFGQEALAVLPATMAVDIMAVYDAEEDKTT